MADDIPDDVQAALVAANHDQLVLSLEEHLKAVAHLQAELEISKIYCELLSNRDVVVSSVFDAQGTTAIPYARISWATGDLTRQGKQWEARTPPEPIA